MSLHIGFKLSQADLEYFSEVMQRARENSKGVSQQQIIANAEKLLTQVNESDTADFVRDHMKQLDTLIGMAVAIILFEGGLTLDREGLAQAPRAIKKLVTLGALITWLMTAGAAWLLLNVTVPIALLIGSLVIVTGPTVVTPLLRRIGVQSRVHHVLHWEAVLIDTVGVFVALLCADAAALAGS